MRLVVLMFPAVCCNFGDARDECRARNGKCKTVPRIDLAYFIAKEAVPVWSLSAVYLGYCRDLCVVMC
jgi:hypothetical protein